VAAADEPEVCPFTIDGATKESFAAAAVDFAGDVLLPEHLSRVRIECPDESLLLRCDENFAAVGHPCQCRRSAEVPIGTEDILRWTVL
jgi:hypothetical protein